MDNFLFYKQNPTIACSMQMAQMQKKKKMTGQIWKKRLFRRYFSHQFKKRIP